MARRRPNPDRIAWDDQYLQTLFEAGLLERCDSPTCSLVSNLIEASEDGWYEITESWAAGIQEGDISTACLRDMVLDLSAFVERANWKPRLTGKELHLYRAFNIALGLLEPYEWEGALSYMFEESESKEDKRV